MRNAVDRDPNNWVYHYGLALVLGGRGRGPARRRSPRPAGSTHASRRTIEAEEAFASTNDPEKWKRRALKARLPIQ